MLLFVRFLFFIKEIEKREGYGGKRVKMAEEHVNDRAIWLKIEGERK